MDRALYVGLTGALQTMRAQEANNNNLANASTLGFRAQLVESMAAPVTGDGLPSRINAVAADGGWDSSLGSVMQTGRDLDVALHEGHWLAVQASDGGDAYTRAGNLQVDSYGRLLTASGLQVLGDGGPISVPPNASLSISSDGTLSMVPLGSGPEAQATIGRLRVVQGGQQELQRGPDGLMRAAPGTTPLPASGEVLISGALEGSNVNLATSMVRMIELARQFELQTKIMHAADENAQASAGLVRMNG